MSIFVLIPTEKGVPVWKDVARQRFGNKCYELPNGEMLVSYDGTSLQLATDLGIGDGTNGAGLVFSVNSYWGFASRSIWEWIGVNDK